MRDEVPGLVVTDEVVRRLEGVVPERQAEEGIRTAVELVHALREIRGVSGVHLIAVRWSEGVARVVEAATLSRLEETAGPAVVQQR